MKKPFYKIWWFWIIAVLIIAAIGSCGDDNAENESIPKQEEKEKTEKNKEESSNEEKQEEKKTEKKVEETPQQKMLNSIMQLMDAKKAFDVGSYIQGDVPAGEYAFVRFSGSGQYYVEKDAAGNIIDNENFDSFGYVYVHGSGNLETKGVLINVDSFGTLGVTGAKQIYETLNSVQNYLDAGYYKVGQDIQPGKYVMESYGQGYVAVMTGPVGKSDIVDNENFNGRYAVNVTNGQYLKVSRAKITQ